jgi:hypothetical protein
MPDTPETIAQSMHEVVVEERAEDNLPQQFGIPEAALSDFRAKVTIYREAVILMLLLSESESQAKLKGVLVAYEKIVFGSIPSPISLQKLNAVKSAMSNLNSLLDLEKKTKEFTWAKEWLNEVGHDEYNPVTLSMFAVHWMDEFVSVGKSIQDLEFIS